MGRIGAVVLVAVLLGALPAAAAGERAGAALVLYSFDDSLPWQRLLRRGLLDGLAQAPAAGRPALYEERLDRARLGENAVSADFEAHLARKYADLRFDTVVAESLYAAAFLRDHPQMFPGARRYYVNYAASDWAPSDGVAIRVGEDFAPAIAAIPAVVPKLRRLVVVSDRTEMMRQRMGDLAPVLDSWRDRLAVEVWDDFTYDELLQRAAGLGADTAVFYMPVFGDRTGAKVPPFETARRLAAAAPVPIFVHYDSVIGSGVVGGYVLSGERLGRLVADILLGRITDPAQAARLGQEAYRTLYDYGPFERFGLDEARLAEGVEMLNHPQSVWQAYRWQIVTVAIAFVIQSLSLAALVVTLRGRNRALLALDAEKRRVARDARELERRNEELEMVAYAASHDLREPLRTVSTYVTLIERRFGDRLDDDGRAFIAFARDAAKRSNRLVLDLLEYSLAGRSGAAPRPVEIGAAVAAATEALRGSIARTGATVTASALPTLVLCHDDVVRLLQNLIDNAISHRHPDRPPEVEVSARREDETWVFCVADNGMGIDPAYFDKVFVLFQRLDPHRSGDGTGIGLTVCRKIVGKYGGRIWVESVPGQGSRFLFTLPEAEPHPPGG
ncbi:MAG: GHKL domain-containing protein [Magnetospirillum sp.]|nr:GHKL domain-containing protein [Magnetospirillum sp.]